MPVKAKKFLITTETREILIISRTGRAAVRGNCDICGQEVGMLTIDSAVTLTHIRPLDLFRMLEDGRVHFVESINGHVLVCEPSLMHTAKEGSLDLTPATF